MLHSTIALADSSGTLQTQYGYDPFGNATVTGASSANPYQFTGRENDGTGLYFYRARYYSPSLQRFASQDPVLQVGKPQMVLAGPRPLFKPQLWTPSPQKLNSYMYALSDPISFTDPSGLDTCQGNWTQIGFQEIPTQLGGLFANCICFYLCVPCNSPIIWSGNPFSPIVPKIPGVLTGNGTDCVCPEPSGGSTGCPQHCARK